MGKRKRTDMFDELQKEGFKGNSNFDYGVEVYSKKKGKKTFVILNAPKIYQDSKKIRKYLRNELTKILVNDFQLNSYNNVLVVGLGNEEFSSDSLGEIVGKEILVTRGLDFSVEISFLAPKVFSQTGIQTSETIVSVVRKIKPECVVFIDALVTTSVSRLGCSFQINNDGISAGSGICNFNRKIDKRFLGVDCLVIGVPFSICANNISNKEKEILLSPNNVEFQVKKASEVVADALNFVFFPNIDESEIQELKN